MRLEEEGEGPKGESKGDALQTESELLYPF